MHHARGLEISTFDIFQGKFLHNQVNDVRSDVGKASVSLELSGVARVAGPRELPAAELATNSAQMD
jgi:hypothetical protein